MKLKIKEFLCSLSEYANTQGIKLDATLFDYDSYEDYLKVGLSDGCYHYFSLTYKKPYYDFSFRLNEDKETVVLVYSNGYDYFPMGSEKDINASNINETLVNLTNALAK